MPPPELPVELWQAVCQLCAPADVRNIRLTCRVLRNASDELLLDAVTPYYHQKHLERLRDITRAPLSIRKGVKRFTFFLDRLEPYDNFHAWDEERGDVFNGNDWLASRIIDARSKHDERPAEIETTESLRRFRDENRVGTKKPFGPLMHERFRRYRELIEYQNQLERGSNLRELLSAFFEACPNISQLEFCIKGYFDRRMLNQTFQSGLIIPRGSSDGGDLAFKETMLAAHDAGLNPKRLSIFYLHTCLDMFGGAFLEKVKEVLKDLVELYWTFERCEETGEPPFDLESFNSSLANGRMKSLLRGCPILEVFEIMGPDFHGQMRSDRIPQLCDMVHGLFWCRLRKVTLVSLQVQSHELSAFLLRHGETLKELSLADMFVSDTDWALCFGLFAGKLPALHSVRLSRSFDAGMHDFIDYYFEDDQLPSRGQPSEPFAQWILTGGEGPPYAPGTQPG